MTRIQTLASRPKRTLGALAVVLAAVGITVGSGANFTATSANPGNAFATGTLTMLNSKANTAVLNGVNLRPGGPAATGTVDISNTGSLQGAFTLTSAASDPAVFTSDYAPLADELNVVVHDCGVWAPTAPSCNTGGTDVFTGKLSAVGTRGLGNYAGGEKHTYKFTVSLPASSDNAFQNKTVHADFTWNAAAN